MTTSEENSKDAHIYGLLGMLHIACIYRCKTDQYIQGNNQLHLGRKQGIGNPKECAYLKILHSLS
jgi:hypothetical protein